MNPDQIKTLDQISKLPTPQSTNNAFECNFFNGTKFSNNSNYNSAESLLLPTGCFVSP